MKTFRTLLLLFLLAGAAGHSAPESEERKRMSELEAEIAVKLQSLQKVEFYEMFYFSSGPEHEKDILEHVRELFRDHFSSGMGEIKVWPLQGEKLRREVRGEIQRGVLRRAPGPPFAYLEVYPADKNDPTYMGINFRLARIDGVVRLVFREEKPGVPQYLEARASPWQRAKGESFQARLITAEEGIAYFEEPEGQVISIPLEELSEGSRERLKQIQERTSIR